MCREFHPARVGNGWNWGCMPESVNITSTNPGICPRTGEIRPVLQSRGLSCNTDHMHNPYWRFDFDINGNGMDQVFRHDDGASDSRRGPGWKKYTNERNDVKNLGTHRTWFVRDQPTGHGGSGFSLAMGMPRLKMTENATALLTSTSRSVVPIQPKISHGYSGPRSARV